MKAEPLLKLLEEREPRIVLVASPLLVPKKRPRWPVSPTHVLARYRRSSAWLLDEDVPQTTQDLHACIHLNPWGWLKIVEPRIAMAEDGGEFPGRHAAAQAIAKVDRNLKPIPLGREWLLTHESRPDIAPLLVTVAFWLSTRHTAFVTMLNRIKTAEEPAVPITIVRSLLAPPDTPIQ